MNWNTTLVILFIVLFATGMYNFFIGFHNADTGQNMRYLEAKWHTTLIDTPAFGGLGSNITNVTSTEAYLGGIRGMFIGFLEIMIAGVIALAAVLHQAESFK